MQDQKIESQLNMALAVPEAERERTFDLDTGYNSESEKWEVVVRYNGNLDSLIDMGVTVTILTGGYAILNLKEELIEIVAAMPEIEYMEKPKSLFFHVQQSKSASCFSAVQKRRNNLQGGYEFTGLTGKGVIVAVIDSGVDYSHPDFINDDGTTRIRYIWDQSVSGNPPEGYNIGTEYTAKQINEALNESDFQERYRIVPENDTSGHGTHVLGIAAGNGRASGGKYAGCAPDSDIIVVKLGNSQNNPFPMTTELMQGIDYVIKKSAELRMPVAINISIGNSYGSHTGDSLLETFIDDISGVWSSSICVGTGNEGAADRHFSKKLGAVPQTAEIIVYEYTPAFSIQIWKNYYDEFDLSITAPDKSMTGRMVIKPGINNFTLDNTDIIVYFGEPTPYSVLQEIYIEMIPKGNYFNSGIWLITLYPNRITYGAYNMWLPSGGALNTNTSFLTPSADTTLTIPSTARRVISVGAYDSGTGQPAYFSGRGYQTEAFYNKPEIVAPGVNITSAAPGGAYDIRTGTSMAVPFVTGAAACLMQWGITDGNDEFLYGEKVKAYLISGARQLTQAEITPNPLTGFGALCLSESIPK